MTPLLRVRALAKRYGAVEALGGVDLEVLPGEILGICGDNGAGKSTLIRIVSGAQIPSGGGVEFAGSGVSFRSPADALAAGIATIYQDLALAPRLPVYQNVFMGDERRRPWLLPFLHVLDKPRMRAEARAYLERLKIDLHDVDRPVADLSGGQRQAVAISRALHRNARLVIMDEPTAALGVRETAQVLDLIRELHTQGVTVILVSHNMEDVVAVTTRVAVLRNGRKVAEVATKDIDADGLAHLIMRGGNRPPA